MIFHFPNHDTLRLALTSGAIPPTMSLSSARALFDADGQTWVEPTAPLDKSAQADLRRLGVDVLAKPGALAAKVETEIHAWPQLLPLERDSRPHTRPLSVCYCPPGAETLTLAGGPGNH